MLVLAVLVIFGHLIFSLGFDSDPHSVKGLNPGFNLNCGSNPEECEWPGRQSVSPFALIG